MKKIEINHMKKMYTFLLATVLVSCGGDNKKSTEDVIASGNLEALRAKRGQVVASYDAMGKELKMLDEAISKLDTTAKVALVTAIGVKDTLFNHYVELQGSVDTKQNILINAEYPGIVRAVYVKEGQPVSKGQLLAKIDDGGLSAQLAQLQVQADLAKTTYDRQKRLWDQKIGSEIQYLQAKTQYESNLNAVSQLKSQLAKTTITAPFSGTIERIESPQGSTVNAGVPVLRIVNLSDMYVRVEVPERYLANVKKGTSVKVNFPILNKTIDGVVRQASNYINPSNRAFEIEVAVPNKEGLIRPNLTARVSINDYTNNKALLIPQSIISENAEGDQYVYVVGNPNKDSIAEAHRVKITTGKTQGDVVEVLEGLKAGDDVVSEGARRVQEGQKVKITKNVVNGN